MKGTISNLLRMPNTPLTQDNKSVFTVANEPTGHAGPKEENHHARQNDCWGMVKSVRGSSANVTARWS